MNQPSLDPEAFHKFEIAGWAKSAEAYQRFWAPITSRAIDRLLDAARVGAAVRTLDVASGPGYVTARAAERGATTVGVDLSPQMIALATKLHPGLEFRQADVEHLPFADKSFQAVVSNFIVPHLARPEQAVAELTRVLAPIQSGLAPGGRLALTTWDTAAKSRLNGIFTDAIEEVGAAPPPGLPLGPPFLKFAVDQEFAKLLRSAGLVDAQVDTIAFTVRIAGVDEFWNDALAGGVRTPAMIFGQTPEVQQRIRAAFDRLARQYVKDGSLEIPASVKIASGTKPR